MFYWAENKGTPTYFCLNLALQYVAQLNKTAAEGTVFAYGGNTYIFVDTVTSGGDNQLDDGDFAVKLTGTVDLDLLVASLNPFVPA